MNQTMRWRAHPAGQQPPQTWRRKFATGFGVLGFLIIISFALGYFWPEKAYGWEEAIAKYRPAWPLLCLCAGWWNCDHRAAIGSRLQELFDAFLGKSNKSPWALAGGARGLNIIRDSHRATARALDKIVSFRAGDVEVKLGSSSTTLRESARIALKQPTVSNSITGYDSFNLFNTKGDKGDKDYMMHEKLQSRLLIYSNIFRRKLIKRRLNHAIGTYKYKRLS